MGFFAQNLKNVSIAPKHSVSIAPGMRVLSILCGVKVVTVDFVMQKIVSGRGQKIILLVKRVLLLNALNAKFVKYRYVKHVSKI